MHLNPFAISGLVITITYLPLFYLVFIRGRDKISLFFSFHMFSVFIWGIASFLIGVLQDPEIVFSVWKLAFVGIIFIPVFLLHGVLIAIDKYSMHLMFFVYAQAFYFLISTLRGQMFQSVKLVFNSFYYHQGSNTYFIFFIIWSSIVILIHFGLIRFYQKTFPKQKRQILLLIFAIPIGFGGGIMNFLPGFGIKVYPYGNFLVPIYSLIFAYAILKYQFLDIKIIIQKSLLYSVLVSIITLIYLLLVLIGERFLQGLMGYRSLFVSLVSASIIAVLFIPIRNKIQIFIDRFFLGRTPEQIAQENKLLKQELLRSERLKAVAMFASGMAHEIKNPLTAIKTFVEYLPQKIEDKEFVGKFSNIVGSEVKKIDGLVHQLLDFSKPTPLQISDADVHKLIDETLELLSNEFIRHNIRVKKDYYNNAELIAKIDSQRMKQAFLNLFINAIDAMPRGGEIFVRTIKQENQLRISIKDTGCGIPEKDLPHIFEPFYSLKNKGTGLGLSIVHSIIEKHESNIHVESNLNKGLEFVIELKNTV